MPHLFIFLIKVNLALLIFCGGYYLVLRRLTFYTLNRIYLVGAIVFASVYPRINISGFLNRHRQIAEPVQAIAYDIKVPPKTLIKPMVHHPGWWQLAQTLFWLGVMLFGARLLIQFISLYRIYRKSSRGVLMGHRVRLMDGDGGPFSFWTNIYINPACHEAGDLKAILQHEQIHIDQFHTADILLAEISTIFYWFNPGIWLMKKAIRENIEFITDRKILRGGADSKQYQYSLVNVSFAAAPQGIVNHFNISTIKKRIIMMNAKRSSNLNLTRYAFLVPAVVLLLLVFTISRAALIKNAHKTNAPIANPVKAAPASAGVKLNPHRSALLVNAPILKLTPFTKTIADTSIHIKYLEAADTGKKHANNPLVIKPSMYIVDGIIEKDYDISKVDTNEIVSINIGRLAKDGTAVVYVQTKNGIPARSIKTIRINGKPAENFKGVVVTGRLSIVDTEKLADGKLRLDTVWVNGQAKLNKTLYNVKPFKNQLSYTVKPQAMPVTRPLTTVYATTAGGDGNEITLSHLSDKLIIINGNIATKSDLKKLSAFDIDRMVLKTDEETRELYGDKAKNGVVFILTKKKG